MFFYLVCATPCKVWLERQQGCPLNLRYDTTAYRLSLVRALLEGFVSGRVFPTEVKFGRVTAVRVLRREKLRLICIFGP